MARRPTLDLQVNLPLVATLKYADWFVHEEYGEKLKGALVVEPAHATDAYPAGEYTHFFHPGADEELLGAGAIREMPLKDGVRQFRVNGKPSLILTVSESKGPDGKRRRHTAMEVDGVAAGGDARQSAPPSRSPASSEPPAESAPARRSAPAQAEDATAKQRRMAAEFVTIGDTYAAALLLARHGFQVAGLLPDPITPEFLAALQSGAATIMIQADRAGLRGYRGMAKAFAEWLERTDPAGERDARVAAGGTERELARRPTRENRGKQPEGYGEPIGKQMRDVPPSEDPAPEPELPLEDDDLPF